jgi:hypothetical protein
VTIRFARHARQNVVAYIALMFSVIGGGGGYAIAATTHHSTHAKPTAVVACASKRSGELFLHHHGKCAKGRHKVQWSIRGPRGRTGAAGAAGSPAPSIFAAVDADSALSGLQPTAEKGMTVTRDGVGVYTLTITDPTCVTSTNNVPTVTPTSRFALGEPAPPMGATPVAYLDDNIGISSQFVVHVGYVNSAGAFVPLDYYFDALDTCLPPSSESRATSTR